MLQDQDEPSQATAAPARPSLLQVASFFLRLGTIAFGGPAAHIALMEDELVRRRRWLDRQQFLDLMGASNLLPGPSSTELAIFIGYRLAGLLGLLAAGICFIVPAGVMVTCLAWAYVRYGHLHRLGGILYGLKPVVIAIVLQALARLAKTAIKSRWLGGVAIAATAAAASGVDPMFVLLGGGLLGILVARRAPTAVAAPLLLGTSGTTTAGTAVAGALHPGLLPIFAAFLKIGCIVFGSGYVLLAFLQDDLVTRRGWLSSGQILDAVAVGQVTPGPVFTTATFIGYLLGGFKGAAAATVAIFLPAFVLVAISGPLVAKLRKNQQAGAFLDGLNAASLGLMAVVLWQLGRTALTDWITVAIAVISAFLLLGVRLNATWLIAAAALVGFLRG